MITFKTLEMISLCLLAGAFVGCLPMFILPTRKWNHHTLILEIGLAVASILLLLFFVTLFMMAGAKYVKL